LDDVEVDIADGMVVVEVVEIVEVTNEVELLEHEDRTDFSDKIDGIIVEVFEDLLSSVISTSFFFLYVCWVCLRFYLSNEPFATRALMCFSKKKKKKKKNKEKRKKKTI